MASEYVINVLQFSSGEPFSRKKGIGVNFVDIMFAFKKFQNGGTLHV